MGWLDALLIGIAQGAAIIPGISRSGATISTGLFWVWIGTSQESSPSFSRFRRFLGRHYLESRKIDIDSGLGTILIGTAVACVVGYFCLEIS